MKNKGVSMQVNSISSIQTQSAFGNKKVSQREILETFANADDVALKQAAFEKASFDVNDKKHKRVSNALYLSLAPAIGLAAAIKQPAQTVSALTKNPIARSLRLKTFVGNTLGAVLALGAIDITMKAISKLENSNKKLKEFTKEHPTMSFLSAFGAGIGALSLLGSGVFKLQNLVKSKPVKFATKKLAYQINNKLNNSKVLNALSKGLDKVPSAIKGFTKGLINWSPMLIILANINHSFAHARAKGQATMNNYLQLKETQAQVRTALAETEE